MKIKTLFYGFFMGTAELLPGISGSTVALIFGIYEKFIIEINNSISFILGFRAVINRSKSLKECFKAIKEVDIVFLVLLMTGMILAFGLLSGLIITLFEVYPYYVLAILLGLVIAALPIPFSQIKLGFRDISIVIVVSVLLFVLLGISENNDFISITPIYLFFAGLLGISGMVIPGLSGSFILLVLGVYYYVLSLLHDLFSFNLSTEWFIDIASFGFGVIIGFLTVAKVLKVALEKHRSVVMAVIGGLLIGSIRLLNPFVEAEIIDDEIYMSVVDIGDFSNSEIILIISLVLVTAVVVGGINLKRARKGDFDAQPSNDVPVI